MVLVQARRALTPIVQQSRRRPWIAAPFAIMLASGVATIAFPGSADTTGPLGMIAGMGGAGVIALRGAVRLEGRERLAWRIFAVGLLTAMLGILAVGLLSMFGTDVPAFGVLDSFFILCYLLVFVFILVLPHAQGSLATRARAMADGLVGAVSLAIMAWVLFLSGYLDRLVEAPPWQRAIAMSYPILDVALLIALLMLSIRRSTYWHDRRLLLVSIALIFQTAGDLLFAASGIGVAFEQAEPIYPLYMASATCLLAAASIVHKTPSRREVPDRPAHSLALVAPYGAAMLLLATLVWKAFESGHIHLPLLAAGTATVVVLTFARQAVAIRENRDRVDIERQGLVSSISHELLTPLTSMFGMLELVRAGEIELTEGERKEFVETATEQARHMARIVSDMIMLARDGDDSVYVNPTRCRLDRLVADAVAHVEGSEATEIVAPAMTVTVDKGRLEQAVANMVRNAILYGGGRVIVTAVAGENVVIEVHDDGPGVPTKYEFVIWSRFERGLHRLDSRIPGSGNGLAIVAKVARAHGGTVGYRRSEVLGGACFVVSIPRPWRDREAFRIGAIEESMVGAG